MNDTKRILAVLAHPDDESFGMGGSLALYARQGVEVFLICATRGEVGEVDPQFMKEYNSIAELREAELRCAADYLGMQNVFFLGYRDSGMPGMEANNHPNAFINAPLEKVTGEVVSYIRELKPDLVLTFDPVGGYHHPDHIHIHNATVAAFEAAGNPGKFPELGKKPYQPKKLLYHLFPRNFVRWAVRLLKLFGKDPTRFGRNNDINLEKLAGDVDYPSHYEINYKSVDHLKEAASNCHASQIDFSDQSPLLMRLIRKVTSGKDLFMQAAPPIEDTYHAGDLFADL
ncbi:MAG TPA: PIG-L deacetylase family protein [Anaerolineales bacterium]|nr:PIG-L deacetylase family protein [Anaerolineales bacterium]